MARIIRLAAAQMGATHRDDTRQKTLLRMLALLEQAAAQGAQSILFPELAFTTFFPRYVINDPLELETWFEHGDITEADNTKPLFDRARSLGIDISVGFAEATDDGDYFNSCVYYHAKSGSVLSKYRKIHLPGSTQPFTDPDAAHELEKVYFKPGNLGFQAFRVPDLCEQIDQGEPIFGMMICYDRRWSESWRVLGLQGTEIVLCGYNTAGWEPHLFTDGTGPTPQQAEKTATFQHQLVMQAHSYTNACFSVSAGRAGWDDHKHSMIGGSCIIDPEGTILIQNKTLEDEILVADCNLDLCTEGKTRVFDFASNRRIEHYSRITHQTGVTEPPRLFLPRAQHPESGYVSDVDSAAPSCTKGITAEDLSTSLLSSNDSARPIRILLVNPTSDTSITNDCLRIVAESLPSDVSVTGFTSPQPATVAGEGHYDDATCAAMALQAMMPIAHEYDAFVVACYSHHPLSDMLKDQFTQPTVSMIEASFFAVRSLGNHFGIVTMGQESTKAAEHAIREYGYQDSCLGVQTCDLGVTEPHSTSEKAVMYAVCHAAEKFTARGADCLTLGSVEMLRLKREIEDALGDDIMVIDGVFASVHHLAGLVRMRGSMPKRPIHKNTARGMRKSAQPQIPTA